MVFILILGVVLLTAALLLYGIDRENNFGFEFGYYGQFNRFKGVIETIPNVEIVETWQHHDVSLEDFRFFLLIDGERKFQLNIYENNPIKKERSKAKIKAYIEQAINQQRSIMNGEDINDKI